MREYRLIYTSPCRVDWPGKAGPFYMGMKSSNSR